MAVLWNNASKLRGGKKLLQDLEFSGLRNFLTSNNSKIVGLQKEVDIQLHATPIMIYCLVPFSMTVINHNKSYFNGTSLFDV